MMMDALMKVIINHVFYLMIYVSDTTENKNIAI